MNFEQAFSEKIIWITGASSGIGEHLAYALSQAGAKLVLSARRENELERVKAACENSEQHRIYVLDMLNQTAIEHTAQQVLKDVGTIDYLFNNAGVTQRSLAKNTSMDVYRKIMEVNYFSKVVLTQAIVPSMVENGSGHIITMSSIAGLIGVPYRSAYSSAKHAIIGYMDALRAEVHDAGLHVTVICPGFIKTNIIETARKEGTASEDVEDTVIKNGMDVEVAVDQMLNAVAAEKPTLIVAQGKEKLAPLLKRISPSLIYKIMRKAKVT